MSRRTKRRRALPDVEPVADINTTPLIDVMLVLLVMLIITIPIQLHSVNLNLPVSTPPLPDTPPEVLRIHIDPRSVVFFNGTAVADAAELKSRLQGAAAQAVPPEVHVRPDKAARYEAFADVMVAVNQAGLQKLGVVGSEQFIDK
ncbi:ExbD/TolR family protein [Aquabacterium sp.]|uniref:ExbD/TolR family protein n=1 Tax=Aquabacterium sp. TaxID=1872578 RepID=UPI002D0C8F9D|nr:biopolymer transporter ExbD [Aquabacterium sp.]HSW05523.1 biopolymer transporter ExbD [Aquabacterium sp.]